MNAYQKRYQQNAVNTATPEELILKLYDAGIASCHREDRQKLRDVLVELMGSLNHEAPGDLSGRLHALYEYCINESATGDLDDVREVLEGLREAWAEGVVGKKQTA